MTKFYSIEGIDGAGKSSHLSWLTGVLQQRGETVICTREPGGTSLGEKLRTMLLSDPMDINTELMLMFAARRQHLTEVIEPALAAGKTVISDRFTDSSYAFQGARGVPYERIQMLDDWCGGARPDITFLFDLPVEVASARISGSRDLDRFEREKQDYHERVRTAYLHRAALEPHRVRIINSNQSIDAIRHDLLCEIETAITDNKRCRNVTSAMRA